MATYGMSEAERRLQLHMRRRANQIRQSSFVEPDPLSDPLNKALKTELIDINALQQKDTDYRGIPHMENLPLKVRARMSRSKWPIPNRTIDPKVMPASRNYGTIWRRYPNGTMDLGWAYGKLSEAIDKFATGIPLNENDALAISSVFPEKEFSNLPKLIVDVKAFLSAHERDALRAKCSRRLLEDLFGKTNNDL